MAHTPAEPAPDGPPSEEELSGIAMFGRSLARWRTWRGRASGREFWVFTLGLGILWWGHKLLPWAVEDNTPAWALVRAVSLGVGNCSAGWPFF